MRKIALSGMKGRKKDTFLLSFVVALSFIFIILATIFHASSEETKLQQRTAMFGSWEASYLNGDLEVVEKLQGKKEVDKLGVSRILGKSSTLGVVGTINKDLEDLGAFTMYEGRMPEKDNEIALELNQLSYFNKDIKVGDTVPMEIVIPIYWRPEEEAIKERIYEIIPEIEEKWGFKGLRWEIDNYEYRLMDYIEREMKGELTQYDNPWIKYSNPIWSIYYNYARGYKRNEQSLESFQDTKVVIKTSYSQVFVTEGFDYRWGFTPGGEAPPTEEEDPAEPKEVKPEELSMISQDAHITRDMIVTGIIQNYSNQWDVGDEPVANAFVTEEGGKAFIENGFLLTEEIEVTGYETPLNIFIGTNIPSKDFYDTYENEFEGLIRNTYAYPDITGSTESTLTYGILVAIFLATIFAVFQIYLTQTRRRTRRIALLKSIGAVGGQIAKVLLWEVVYLLLLVLPISIVFGLGISKLVLFFMNKYGNTVLNFHIYYRLTLFGIGLGVMAVFIGMLFPMIMSMRVPLTGNISKPVRKKSLVKGKLKTKAVSLDMKIQSFRRISIKNIRYNKGKTLLTAGLYTITTSVLLGSIYLCFIFFGDYIDDVIITNKPSYGYEFNHALTNRSIPEFLDSIYEVDGISRVELYKAGEHAYLWHENIDKNEIYPVFKEILPHSLVKEHFGINDTKYVNLNDDNIHLVKDAVVTNIYGIDPEEPLFNKFKDSLTVGSLNKEKFQSGEEVILLIPIYEKINGENKTNEITEEIILSTNQKNRMEKLLRNSNNFNMTYDFRYKENYAKDESISVGDTIHLTVPTENVDGDMKTNDVRFIQTNVAGIIYYFPEKGIWPFMETVENPVIVGSYGFLGKTHPATVMGKGNISSSLLEYLMTYMVPTKYGKTLVYIYEDNKADEVELDVNINRIARENEVKLTNYKEENKQIFGKAFNISAIITILGLSVAIITLIILYNTTLSKLEQERERIGTFQALGVTGQQFKRLYLFTGMGYGLLALIISHILLATAVLLTSLNTGRTNTLWLYPWKVHIAISIITFSIILMTYYLPIRKIIRNQPIDNIRNLSR